MALSTMNAPSPALKGLIAIPSGPLERVFEGLRQVVKEAWGAITAKALQELVHSMKRSGCDRYERDAYKVLDTVVKILPSRGANEIYSLYHSNSE
jgi:hypothetical protein